MSKIVKSIETILAEYMEEDGPLLPVLHAVNGSYGYIPVEAFGSIAEALNLSAAELAGVVSFYHDFRSEPTATNVVKICRAEACQAMGARELEDHAKATLDLAFGESCLQQGIALDAVYCLGNCACGPSVSINERVHARVTPRKFDQLLAVLKDDARQV